MLKNISLKLQFTLFFVFFVAAIYSMVIITSLQQITWLTVSLGADRGMPIVDAAAAVIDGDSFEALSKSLDPQDPYYEKTRLALLDIKEQSGCLYLYTMAPAGGSIFRYIIDGSGPPDNKELFSPLGAEEDIAAYLKPVLQVMDAKTKPLSRLDNSTQYGFLSSTWAAILNSSGEAVGVIGCDFMVEDLAGRLWFQMWRQFIVCAVFSILGFAGYLYLLNRMSKQNQHLRELKERAEAVSLELKEERDTIAAMKDALKVGLFFMDKDFIIQEHYSKALESILEVKKLGGKKFTDLLTARIKEQDLKNLREYLGLLFNRSSIQEEDMLKQMNPIPRMYYTNPETGEEKTLNCKFVLVDRGGGGLFIMGNLQDITRESHLQRQLTAESQKSMEEISKLKSIIQNMESGGKEI
ncbi:MAG: hypothetical protein LBQ88_23325 [Treponema sp.]|jgi:hypothetical protein|nr:hypothetical protein [Treponema sp.]